MKAVEQKIPNAYLQLTESPSFIGLPVGYQTLLEANIKTRVGISIPNWNSIQPRTNDLFSRADIKSYRLMTAKGHDLPDAAVESKP